jgi:polysaccharide pyruvyl transferase WcaK-like protein
LGPEHGPGDPLRLGLWGSFDVENYGDALFPRLARHELGRRLPGAVVRSFGLVGDRAPSRFDGGPIEPLGEPTPERLTELAGSLDLVIVGAGEIIHVRDEEWAAYYPIADAAGIAPSRFFVDGLGPGLEEECPVVWHAVGVPFDIDPPQAPRFRRALADRPHVSVRDRASRERLRAAGVTREIAVVPDPAVLLPRVLPPETLRERVRGLRAEGAFPAADRVLAVQASRAHLPQLDAIAAAVRRLAGRIDAVPLLVETGPCHGDGEFATALADRLPDAARLGPAGTVDLTAAIAGSVGFVGVSLHGNIAALGYGRPHVVLGMNGESKLWGLAAALGDPDVVVRSADEIPDAFEASAAASPRLDGVRELQERADAQFDALAEVARRTPGRPARGQVGDRALRDAYEARGRRLVAERWRMADRLSATEEELAAAHEEQDRLRGEIARREERIRELEREVAGKQGELDRLLATRTFRYTAAARRLYGRLRALFRPR